MLEAEPVEPLPEAGCQERTFLFFFFRVKVSEEPAEQMLSTSSASPPCSVRSPFPQALLRNPPRNGTCCWPNFRAAEKVKSAQPTEPSDHLAGALPTTFVINITHTVIRTLMAT